VLSAARGWGQRMKSHCLPFRQIPHGTRLFLDYLEFTPSIQPFYPRSPHFLEWANDESTRIGYPVDRRTRMANVLERQNKAWGASTATLENIARFRSGACAVVTGQQVGLFGGPVFSIYKALSAVKLASEARRLGLDCVPIFWLATEDHDLEEINQIRIPATEGPLERIATSVSAAPDTPVGNIAFGPEISETVNRVTALLGETEAAKLLSECYRPGETFGTAFAKFFARLFSEFGVILLDGSDPELDEIAYPLYCAAIERASELSESLRNRDAQLHAADYHQQVRVTDSSMLLFVIRDGVRVPVQSAGAGKFLIGKEEIAQQQLLDLAVSSPHSFSPNVLLRPVVQDYVLPTLAYVGGAAEVAYFAQAAVVYQELAGRITPILPRFSATLIEQKAQALLEKYRLAVPDVFHGPEALRETIGAHLLPPNLQSSFDQATAAVERSMKAVRESLGQLDKTLVESAEHAESKMIYQIINLRSRASRAELRQSEVVGRHAEALSNALYPDKTLQEREYAGVYFLARHGKELRHGLLDTIHPDCLDHQLVTL
jgi:bacillithiol biosynthesis cysteine-adding enzyme BshC